MMMLLLEEMDTVISEAHRAVRDTYRDHGIRVSMSFQESEVNSRIAMMIM